MYTTKQDIFSERLKQLRIAAKLTQSQLAKELNVSRSCLANYEAGKRFPDADIISIISQYFKVSVDFLLTCDNYIQPENISDSEVTELLKVVSSSGKLDLSRISPLSKIALLEFYNFLDEQERNKSR